ncbi:unnamed protein product [Polarella glacialis]|uniref:Uncharacterized protein n=1 Tax=Polarella glacialis TaxID=89957 RepID=A0A813DM57_POLGL|nr:unnamed protein product [Polarella glacialis]
MLLLLLLLCVFAFVLLLLLSLLLSLFFWIRWVFLVMLFGFCNLVSSINNNNNNDNVTVKAWYKSQGKFFSPVEFASVEVMQQMPPSWLREDLEETAVCKGSRVKTEVMEAEQAESKPEL